MNSFHALKFYPVEIVTVKVLDYDCMQSVYQIKEIDQTPAVLFIPLVIDMIGAFAVSLFFNLIKSNTHTHLRNRCTKGRGVFVS